jgi:hypothetical protein
MTEKLIPVYVTGGYTRSAAAPNETVNAIARSVAHAFGFDVTNPGDETVGAIAAGIKQFATQTEFWLIEYRRIHDLPHYKEKSPAERDAAVLSSLHHELRQVIDLPAVKVEEHYEQQHLDDHRWRADATPAAA